ncbi:hypothetical protein Enr8_07270 [Blastopirellula retiformator]|uniref:Uncharacterized protein n=1 Tax=Blastopirellula retiformator TaxID=2527970 RepID=A0A5C5VMT9_9BACT|nr:hypothetical protein Enr8_07270 [Blastopirellula retiformator]
MIAVCLRASIGHSERAAEEWAKFALITAQKLGCGKH